MICTVSKPHLQALEEALARKGWRIVAVHPGNDYDISATWEIRRSTRDPSVFIDFDGMDGDGYLLPLEKAYGCQVGGRRSVFLYFSRINRSRERWESELEQFVNALDEVGVD